MPNGNRTTGRKDSLIRAFKTIRALERSRGVTARELGEILGLSFGNDGRGHHSHCNAMRWIDAAGSVLPVVEIGKRRHGISTVGPIASVYGIMED